MLCSCLAIFDEYGQVRVPRSSGPVSVEAAPVAKERHLWLNLSGIKEKDKVFLLDALLPPSGLFSDTVNTVINRFQHARKQSVAFQQFLPRRSISKSKKAVPSGQPQPSLVIFRA